MDIVTVSQVVGVLDALYPRSWASDWDAVGTVAGDPAQPCARVMFAVDPVQAVVDEAIGWAADLLVVHHPLLLTPVSSVAADTPKGRVVHRLIRGGVALHVCHTNADSPAHGVSDSLADALGVQDAEPLEPAPAPALDKIVTFVPPAQVDQVVDALAAAGAGALGAYDRCAFTSTGVGTFRPNAGASPWVGTVGRVERVEETRVEMIAARECRTGVVRALRISHPYEEPAFDVLEIADRPSGRGSGRVGRLQTPQTLAMFAGLVASVLPAAPQGVRVAGDPARRVERVAVCGGAGDFLLDRVLACGADAYVTSDLRHHPASEFAEHPDAPALVDVAHWSAEWTWLPAAERAVREVLQVQGTTVETRVSRIPTDPWTFLVGQDFALGSRR